MLLAGGCGDTNGPPQIGKTEHLGRAYAFGRALYPLEPADSARKCRPKSRKGCKIVPGLEPTVVIPMRPSSFGATLGCGFNPNSAAFSRVNISKAEARHCAHWQYWQRRRHSSGLLVLVRPTFPSIIVQSLVAFRLYAILGQLQQGSQN